MTNIFKFLDNLKNLATKDNITDIKISLKPTMVNNESSGDYFIAIGHVIVLQISPICKKKRTSKPKLKLTLTGSVTGNLADVASIHETPESLVSELLIHPIRNGWFHEGSDFVKRYLIIITELANCIPTDSGRNRVKRLIAGIGIVAQATQNSDAIQGLSSTNLPERELQSNLKETLTQLVESTNEQVVRESNDETGTVGQHDTSVIEDDSAANEIISSNHKKQGMYTVDVYQTVVDTMRKYPIIRLLQPLTDDTGDPLFNFIEDKSKEEVEALVTQIKNQDYSIDSDYVFGSFSDLILVNSIMNFSNSGYNEADVINYVVSQITDYANTLFDNRLLEGAMVNTLAMPDRWVTTTNTKEVFTAILDNQLNKKGGGVTIREEKIDSALLSITELPYISNIRDELSKDTTGALKSLVEDAKKTKDEFTGYSHLNYIQLQRKNFNTEGDLDSVQITLIKFDDAQITFIAYMLHINLNGNPITIGKVSKNNFTKQAHLPDALLVLSAVAGIDVG